MAKTFAQINCSILRSKKLKQCKHSERWVYLCAHFTSQGTFTAFFRYPLVMWALDANMEQDDLKQAVERLTSLGLIEYDADEEVVRIVGAHRQRPPENASQVTSMLRDFAAYVPDNQDVEKIYLNCVAEFVVASVKRAQRWKSDSPEWPKLREALKPFLRQLYQEQGESLLVSLVSEIASARKSVRTELGSLFPELEWFQEAPCHHPTDTVPAHVDVDETDTNTETKTKTKKKTAQLPTQCEVDDVTAAATLAVLRKGEGFQGSTQHTAPREETKRSALVQKLREGTRS
jgi:hypothetical protein